MRTCLAIAAIAAALPWSVPSNPPAADDSRAIRRAFAAEQANESAYHSAMFALDTKRRMRTFRRDARPGI